MIDLRGQTALVTGGAKRLGGAVARALARRGVHLVIHYRSSAGEAEALAAELTGLGVKAWTVLGDLGDPAICGPVFEQAVQQAGAIDILVNNASIFPDSRLDDFTADQLFENVQVNAMAPAFLCRLFAAQKRPGTIVNFLDTRILDYDRRHVAYHLSKRMLHALTKMMAVEYAPAIRVNAVAPGLVLPPPGQDERYLERLTHTNPLQRHGSADDVAEAAVFLIASDFVTGQVLYVDGGRHLKGKMYD